MFGLITDLNILEQQIVTSVITLLPGTSFKCMLGELFSSIL